MSLLLNHEVVYPESDGQLMADNTQQFRWIVLIKENLEILFADDPQVFVAGDLLWYPIEGNSKICQAPDVMVVFGRPKGDRGSYLQWEEEGIAPQVVFEVLSPSNRLKEMTRKLQFYDRFGVEEYYLYDPDRNDLHGLERKEGSLTTIEPIEGWVSPRLGVRFSLRESTLEITRPDGERFLTQAELSQRLDQERVLTQQERDRAEQERARAEQERARAEQERARADRLAAHLRSLGVDPDSLSL